MNKYLFLFVVLHWCFWGITQVDSSFLKHLERTGLKEDHFVYLKQLNPSETSTQHLFLSYYLRYEEDSALLNTAKQFPQTLADTQLLYGISLHFLPQTDGDRETWFALVDPSLWRGRAALIHSYYCCTLDEKASLPAETPDELRETGRQMQRKLRKKPWIAALMSTVIPGSGRWYAGRWHLAAGSFLINGVNVWRTSESVNRLGAGHPLSLVNFGMLAVFYVSNITGSAREVKLVKLEHRNQFLYEVATYYRLYHPAQY